MPILALITVVPFLVVDLDDAFGAVIPPLDYPAISSLGHPGGLRSDIHSSGIPLVKHSNNSATINLDTSYDHYRIDPVYQPEGDITIDKVTMILPNPKLTSIGCTVKFGVNNVGANPSNAIHEYAKLPTNVDGSIYTNLAESDVKVIGVDFKDYSSGCDVSTLTTANSTNEPLLTDKSMRVTIYGQAGKKAFFSSHFENITKAQLIPECTSANFDNSTKQLKGQTRMCSGTYNNDLVIITTQIGEYGATSTILPPDTLPIIPPSSFPTTVTTSRIPLSSAASSDNATIGSTNNTRYQIDGTLTQAQVKAGDIYMQGTTTILSNPFFTGKSYSCNFEALSIHAQGAWRGGNFDYPANIQPKGNANNPASLSFNGLGNCAFWSPTHSMITDKEMRITIYDKSGSKAWYLSPSQNITQAQPIPACTTETLDTSDNTLKGNTKMCYGVYSDHLIIVTKRFIGAYGSATTITPPQNPVDLDLVYPIPPGTLSIPPPSGFPTSLTSSDAPYMSAQLASDNGTIGATSPKRYQIDGNQNVPVRAGDIYIQGTTTILSNPFFVGKGYTCPFNIFSLHTERTFHGGGFAYPTNVQPTGNATNPASLTFHGDSTCANWSPTHPMITDKEMRITLDNKTGSKAWYASPRQNITEAQPIPACTTDTINVSTGKLKGNTKMCYGVYEGELIIITKRFLGYYGSADTITTPQNPVDLDSDRPTLAPTTPDPGSSGTLTIPPLTNSSSSSAMNFDSDTEHDGSIYYDGDSKRYTDESGNDATADLYVARGTETLPRALFEGTGDYQCTGNFERVEFLGKKRVPGFAIPDNVTPDKKKQLAAYGLDFYNNTVSSTTSCRPNPEAVSDQTLITDTALRITIYGKADKKPIYFSPRDGILKAQPIPACTTDMIDTSNNNALKGGNTVCYGVHGNDMVIITKRLTGFYGAADSVTTPANPIDLNPATVINIDPKILSIPSVTETKRYSQATFQSNSANDGKIFYAGPSSRLTDHGTKPTGDIYLVQDTTTLVHPLFRGAGDYRCFAGLAHVVTLNTTMVPSFALPDNIVPKTPLRSVYAYGLDFFNDNTNTTTKCSPDPEAVHSQPLVTDKEMRYTIYGKAEKTPYYFSPRDGITEAQPIPMCTTDMIDTSNNALKGNNTVCFGRNGTDMVIITKRLTGFYGVADSVTTPADPTDLNAAIPVASLTNPITGKIQTHEYYTEKINSTSLIEYPNPVFLYNTLPLCEDSVHGTHQTIQMTTKGDILFKYALNGVQFDGRLFLTLTDHTPKKTISLDSNFVQQRGNWYNYNSTLPKSILDQFGNFTSINARLFVTNDTIPDQNIFSNSSTGSPLYYKSQKKAIMELPNAADTVTFVPGKVPGVRGNVHVPQGDTVPLTAEILCQFGHIQPSPSAQVFDLDISADNATNGLEIKYEFTSKTFYQGAKEQKPTKFFWIATDSDGNSVNGDTTRTITNSYNFVIPLNSSGTYDIVMYGSDAERTLIGTHAGSYTFAASTSTPSQTLTITIPNTTPSTATIGLNTQTANEIKFITRETSQGSGTRYHHHDDDSDDTRADITIHYNTKITSKTFSVTSNSFCYNAEVKVGDDITIPKLNNYTALALEITDFTPKCTNYPNISFDGKLVLNKEVYIRLNGTDGQNIFYHVNGTNDIVQIPKCTSTNFNSADNTLKGSTEICYGKDGTDTVIVSKILAIFGATTEVYSKAWYFGLVQVQQNLRLEMIKTTKTLIHQEI